MISVPTPHIEAKKDSIAKTVLMPGDPLRAEHIAKKYLKNATLVNSVRSMNGYTGDYCGKRISVMASGMGIPSMGIYSYELYNGYDVDNIIRIGSAGALQSDVNLMDIVFAMGVSTDSNFQSQFKLNGSYSPVASFDLLEQAACIAKESGNNYHIGNVLTSDFFYSEDEKYVEMWSKMGVLAVEMETAALYMNAARSGKNALAVFTVSDNLITGERLSSESRQLGFDNMIEIALKLAMTCF